MKLMIVDDEPDICEGIRDGIDWESLGIQKVLTACGALEALSLFKHEHPEILITDISMPRMSWIELIERLKELAPDLQCILLSGYSEFEYAKSAIRLGVTAYELKPIKVSHLTELITGIIQKIEDERQKSRTVKLDPYADGQYFIKRLVQTKGCLSPVEYARGLSALDITSDTSVLCLCLQADRYSYNQELLFENKRYMQDIMTLCDKWLGTRQFHLVKLAEHLLILLLTKNGNKSNIPHLFHELNDIASTRYHLSLSMGTGCEGPMRDFFTLYEQSRTAVRNKIYTGRASLIYYNDTDKSKTLSRQYLTDHRLLEQISHHYLNGSLDHALDLIRGRFREIRESRSCSVSVLKDFCGDLLGLLCRMEQDAQAHSPGDPRTAAEGLENTCDTVQEYEDYMVHLYEEAYARIKSHNVPTGNLTIQRTVDYVKAHFSEPLTIEELAAKMNVTPNYLSHLFNREMQMSFRDFLNQYRIYQAKWYLENTSDKAYEIAAKVGFHEYKHFAQIFKKYEGCSTLQYRNRRNTPPQSSLQKSGLKPQLEPESRPRPNLEPGSEFDSGPEI